MRKASLAAAFSNSVSLPKNLQSKRKNQLGLVSKNATFIHKFRQAVIQALSLVLIVSTLSAISIVNAPSATAAGAGLSVYVKNESGRSQDLARSEFTTGTCHTLTTSTIDYQWGVGSPGGTCNSDGFTVYATGQILAPVTGTVTFCAIADDGFYLSINSTVVIDNWIDQGPNSNCNSTGTYSMTAGQAYSIKTWMHENGGGATMQLLWSYAGQSNIIVPATNLGTFCSPSSTSSGGYTILTFTSTTACQWSVPAGVTTADVLVVGGGGGGGRGGGFGISAGNEAGGGGGGGVIETMGISVSGSYLIAVGAGGATNQNGTGSSALGVSVSGGGAGGTAYQPGSNGASGGGGTHNATSGGTGIAGQGFAGGTPSGGSRGGGGGGAGEAGNTDGEGHGGDGKVSAITGATYGGGGTGANNPGALGGTGGGGVTSASFDQPFSVSSNGSANTGGGGAGGFTNSGNDNAGNGGSGVVVIRYVNAPSITLSTSTISGSVNSAISSYSITSSGGPVASYSIPSADDTAIRAVGLSFNTSTGVISGTPSGTLASRSIAIRATNSNGTSTATFSLAVVANEVCSPTVYSSGGYTTLSFTSQTTCDWTTPTGVTAIEVAVVGGGGGGGFGSLGGGGGAGEVLITGTTSLSSGVVSGTSTIATTPGAVTVISIGAGGSTGAPQGSETNAGADNTWTKGGNGSTTRFGLISAAGGGGGGGLSGSVANAINGATGGSGGGGATGGTAGGTGTVGSTPSGWTSLKNSGSSGERGGGGGAGSAGVQGGIGSVSGSGSGVTIWGIKVAGGGLGWQRFGQDSALGGNGRTGGTNYPYYGSSGSYSSAGVNGTGSGGGAGAPGGSGVVIVRYALSTPDAPSITGITAGNKTLSVAFNPPSTNGGAAITNYEYSTDGGSNWRSRDNWPSTASPLVINTTSAFSAVTLVNGTTYNVQIRAVNSVGNGPATSSTTGTPIAPTQTITYAAGTGGSGSAPTSPTTVSNGSTFTTPANTYTRTGYTFAGWNDGTATYTESSTYPATGTVSGNVTLTATWTGNSNTFIFNNNTGSGTMANQTIISGTATALSTNTFTKTGFTFATWNTAANGSGTAYTDGQSITITAGTTLYAQWTANSNTFVFDNNTGSGTMSNQTIASGTATALTANTFTKTGYTFAGWNTLANGTGTSYTNGQSITVTAGATLYAQWTVVSCSPTSSVAFGYTIYRFTTVGTCTWTVPNGITSVEVLAVAGGGGGGYSWGNSGAGGGGGGQVKTGTATLSSTLEVTVGAGGTAGTVSAGRGGSGGDSTVLTITALGGTGGCGLAAPTCSVASMATASAAANGGAGAASNGNGQSGKSGGGSSTTVALGGTRGEGTSSDYSGSTTMYGYGGDGGSPRGSSPGIAGTDGSANTGNGGAGASTASASNGNSAAGSNGGAGGSGLVVIRIANTNTVTFNANDGSGSPATSTQSITTGVATTLTSNTFTRTGYTFNGWNLASAGNSSNYSDGQSVTITGSFTLYAKWAAVTTNAITYDNQGATTAQSGGSTTYTTAAAVATIPTTAPLRTGYTFSGWFTASTGGTQVTNGSYTPPSPFGSITLYARWSAITNNAITYDNQGATTAQSGGSSTYTTAAAVATIPTTAPLRTGFTFSGWFTASTGGTQVTNGSYTPPSPYGSITLYAQWNGISNTFIFNNNTGSGTMANQTIISGTATALSANTFTKTGFTFAGWNTLANGTGTAYTDGQSITITAGTTLYAQWTAAANTFIFDANTGTGSMANQSIASGTSTALSSNTFTKTGYTFAGWNTLANGSGTSYTNGQSITITSGATLYAQWTANSNIFVFNNNTGSGTMANQSITSGVATAITANTFTKTGYSFNGWNTAADASGTSYTDGQSITITAGTTLYAQWTANSNTYIFNNNTGSGTMANQSIVSGTSTALTTNSFSKTGYTFAGWNSAANGTGTSYTNGQSITITSGATLFAQWIPNVYAVSYDWNGGSGSSTADTSYTVGTTAITLPLVGDHVKDGYNFAGWSSSPSGNLISGGYTPTADSTLYAIWGTGSYTVTYDYNWGSVSNTSASVLNGTSLTLPTPTRANFVFDGWYTARTSGSKVGNAGVSHQPTGSKTLYARWIQSSLYGLDPAALLRLGQTTARNAAQATFIGENATSAVSVTVPSGSLPDGTIVYFDLVGDFTRARTLLSTDNAYIISMVVSWLAPDETVPTTNSGKAISLTITNDSIKAGASIYSIVAGQATFLTTATQNGTVTVSITSDPEVVVIATKPNAPTSVAASSNGVRQSIISWSAPVSDGGSAITAYTVTASTGQTCTTATTSCVITGLSNATAYTFTVVATNGVGTSVASTSASASTAGVPTAPTSLTASSNEVQQTTLSWTAPSSNGGSAITGYTVTANTGATCTTSVLTTCTIASLSNGVTYTFTVTATNAVGTSIASASASATTAGVPGAPTSVTASSGASKQSVISWTAPASNGGSTITAYTVTSNTGATCSTSSTTCTITGLSDGTTYTFTVTATNIIGISNASTSASARTADVVVPPAPAENIYVGQVSSSPAPSAPAPSMPAPAPIPVVVVGNNDVKIPTVEVKPTEPVVTPPPAPSVEVKPTEPVVKPTTVKVDSASQKFISEVRIVDGKVVLTPVAGFSGKKNVTVTINENGIERNVQIALTVLPEVVTKPTFTPTGIAKTIIKWTESPNATSYTINLDGKKVCSTPGSSCTVNKILGPSAVVEIISNGGDKTISQIVRADIKVLEPILVGQLVSTTNTKSTLTPVDISTLTKIVTVIKSQGFKTVMISEITMTKKTQAAAEARMASIKKFIKDKTGISTLKFEEIPVTSRTYLNKVMLKL